LLTAAALGLCGALLTPRAAVAANLTWTGLASQPNWSNSANWEGGIPSSGAVDTLTFPGLSTEVCT
jgi:hypothetical protein